jgi:hypothetical protein
MNLFGFLMAEHSSFDGFNIFIFIFAAPFTIFGLGLYFTAKRGEYIRYHRLFGNMLLKGCIGTPLARYGGSILQNMFGYTNERGYYVGIGLVTLLFGVWQFYEIVLFYCEKTKNE